jgi:hypothetical protein
VTVLARDEDGRVNTDSYVVSQLPDDLLADDIDWAIPDLYRSIPTDADGHVDRPRRRHLDRHHRAVRPCRRPGLSGLTDLRDPRPGFPGRGRSPAPAGH